MPYTLDVKFGEVVQKSDPRVAERFKKQEERAIKAGLLDTRFTNLAQFVEVPQVDREAATGLDNL